MTSNAPTPKHTTPPASDPNLLRSLGLGLMVIVTLPVIIGLVFRATSASEADAANALTSHASAPSGPIELGKATFLQTCVVCHGSNADGVHGLGKPIRNSAFVQGATDDELFNLIVNGRTPDDPANTTGVAMLPRAGNPDLDDTKIHAVVSFIKTLQDPNAPTVSMDPWIIAPHPTGEGAPEIAVGKVEFIASCSACHGRTGEGMDGLGRPLAGSEFVASKTDKEMMTFVKTGRPIWDAANTTGIDMPPKGGNPALSDEDLLKIIQYIRSLQADG